MLHVIVMQLSLEMHCIEYLSGFNVRHKATNTVETLGGKPGKGATVDCVAQIFPVSSPDNNRRAAVLLHLPKLLFTTVCDRFHSGELW